MAQSRVAEGVIVADDDSMIRGVLRSKLDAMGHDVFLASDGLEAVELASQTQARLIILDLKMPRLNGLIACERIRRLPGHARTPIVILTGVTDKDAEAAAVRVGATTFLTKPFRSASLSQVISLFLPADEARQDAARAAEPAKPTSTSSPADIKTRSNSGLVSALDRGKNILAVLRR